ncbi:TetR/AcrR family transcriptional regulator [Moritella sp. F3]|uniref:TetR/AcrR family transcriptional regulator n=1 Tax=Moritella sp. F3 TaxID=2718882 RepID=UPI0018E12FA5|nr:helix-turn-helix domain-containing protein [Moritella sp. F3]GIC75311.1 TetR family transcriptional regulator [Moritella sp. F1]GIC80456.1 TetR family transcriptional regulator [Moritella sp. F3]
MSVKDKKRGRPRGSSSQLSSLVIITAAKAFMQEEGKIPSIRKLASTLQIDAMAIYHYFSNKNALLEAITTSLITDIYQPKNTDERDYEGWQSELHNLCNSYLQLLNSYPGLLETLLSMESESPAAVFIDRFEIVISPLQLTPRAAKKGLDLLVDYLHGFALALNCNTSKTALTMDMLAGPLELYCLGLTHSNELE